MGGSHRIRVHTNQHPQVPTFLLVPCPTLSNNISTHFAPDEIPLGNDVCIDSISAECPRPTLVPSTQRNETTLTSVTRDQSSRRRALKATSSQSPISVRTRLATKARRTPEVLFLSCPVVVVASSFAIRTATRCSSAFQFDLSPEPLSTSAFEVCCSRLLSAKRPSLSSRRSLPPGSARLDIQQHGFNTLSSSSMGFDLRTARTAAVWPAVAVETIVFCVRFLPRWQFSFTQANIRNSNIFCTGQKYSRSLYNSRCGMSTDKNKPCFR